ncbi:MAG: hypothetical protein IH897_15470 [Planctomycetes bacterium]|nr:hypothetical protein [Planctomycetota bacterium]
MKQIEPQFVVCLKNDGYSASLEPRKIYRVVPDSDAATHQLIRVIDESGEDYLYPEEYFAPITLPKTLIESLAV